MKSCIVGYGAIGPLHAKAISKINGASVYAICDVDRKTAEKGVNLKKLFPDHIT